MIDRQLAERVEERIRDWGVVVEETLETPSSLVVFGRCGDRRVVLKVLRRPGDEWRSGEVLEAFDGKGIVRAYESVAGAVLLERLSPGTPLAGMVLEGKDEEATAILAEVMRRMSHPRETIKGDGSAAFATVADWGEGFQRHLASGDEQIPKDLVEQGQHIYLELCASQSEARLLHGDLQHYNVLFDSARGWLAIDPKGVVGEIEYEIGAALRNPYERPDLFASPEMFKRRLACYEKALRLDAGRALRWAFSQAVLSAIWSIEDDGIVDADNPAIRLAHAIRPFVG